jgi:hypothetical protein
MKKLTLNVEELAVEQFSTEASAEQAKGTVEAHEASKWWSGCNIHTCYC